MKKVLSIVAFLAVTGAMTAQTATGTGTTAAVSENAAEFQFVTEVFDFGQIPQGVPA